MPTPTPAAPAAETPARAAAADPQPPRQQSERIVEWPPDAAFQEAEAIKRSHGYYDRDSATYGRLSPAMVTQLTRLAQTITTPEALITTEPPTDGKPYTSTGLSSLQPQIDVMHAIFGPPHWRLREREIEDGVLDLELVIGNDLDVAVQIDPGTGDAPQTRTEVLLRHRMRGSHIRGRSHGDRYKGALTNGAKRLLAMAGACADVWRFESDPDESHNTAAAAARDARKPSERQVQFLARLVRETAGQNIDRWIRRIQELTGTDEPPPETISDQYVRALICKLDREHASTLIDALVAIRDERAQSAVPAAPNSGPPLGPATRPGAHAPAGPGEPVSVPIAQRNGTAEAVTIDFGDLGPNTPDAA